MNPRMAGGNIWYWRSVIPLPHIRMFGPKASRDAQGRTINITCYVILDVNFKIRANTTHLDCAVQTKGTQHHIFTMSIKKYITITVL